MAVFHSRKPYYFTPEGREPEKAKEFIAHRSRSGRGLLQYWRVPLQNVGEVHCRLLPSLYIAAYARELMRRHPEDLSHWLTDGWQAVLESKKCIQCSPFEGDEAAKKQVNRLLKTCHKRLKETNAPMSPSVPFCTAHLEAHFVRTYAPSPFFELVSRLVTLLESLPANFCHGLHRVPFVGQCNAFSDDVREQMVPIHEFMSRYHSATAKQQTHCSFAVTLEDIKKQVADDGFDGVQSRAASPFQIMPETWSPDSSLDSVYHLLKDANQHIQLLEAALHTIAVQTDQSIRQPKTFLETRADARLPPAKRPKLTHDPSCRI
jgi:hypothetical protein